MKAKKGKLRKRITSVRAVYGTEDRYVLTLECGHRVRAYGNSVLRSGSVPCLQCLDAAKAQAA
jgi:hypothetical protein